MINFDALKSRLGLLENDETPSHPLEAAAVVVLLFVDQEKLCTLFIKRPEHLRKHPGQIAFPGGRKDAADLNLAATALRELKEEVAVELQYSQLLGKLPSFPTPTGFRVTPFVAKLDLAPRVLPNAEEVAEVFFVPLETLSVSSVEKYGASREAYRTTYIPEPIWGATYFIVRELMKSLVFK